MNIKNTTINTIHHMHIPAPAHLPESMIESIALLPTNKKMILFTRHSLRERSDGQGFTSNQLPLTPKGRVLATSWGKWLSLNLNYDMDIDAISSPIQRCIDTAVLMQEGADLSNKVVEQPLLVEPGSLVVDAAIASPLFKNIGALNFINLFLQDGIDGTKKNYHGCLDFLYLFYQNQPENNQLRLAVSHDTLLAAFLYVVMNVKEIDWDDWPKMMEGAFLWFDEQPFAEATMHYIWRGKQSSIKVADVIHNHKQATGLDSSVLDNTDTDNTNITSKSSVYSGIPNYLK